MTMLTTMMAAMMSMTIFITPMNEKIYCCVLVRLPSSRSLNDEMNTKDVFTVMTVM